MHTVVRWPVCGLRSQCMLVFCRCVYVVFVIDVVSYETLIELISTTFAVRSDWLTDDLLQTLSSRPDLMHRLADPTFMSAVNEFKANPQAAMAKYQNNDAMQSFFRELCAILGLSSAAEMRFTTLRPSATSSPPMCITHSIGI